MGEIEHIKVFTIEGDTPNPVALYRKMAKAFIDLIKIDRAKYYMFSVTDEKRANLYERIGKLEGLYLSASRQVVFTSSRE